MKANGPVALDAIARILVIKLRHHGDVLLASPVFTALKHAAPHAEIDALVYADTADMLRLHPAIRTLHTIDRNWKKAGIVRQAAAEFGLLKELRAGQYELLINLTEHRRGAWLSRLLGVRRAAAPRTAGKDWLGRRAYTHLAGYPATGRRHTVEADIDILRCIGIHPAPEQRRLVLVPGKEAEQAIAAKLDRLGAGGRPLVHVHPCSRWKFKCLPVDTMARVVDGIQEAGFDAVLTAAPDPEELRMVEAIHDRLRRPAIDMAGELTFKELAALAGRAVLFVGVDSAPMHIAAAMGTPTVAVFGPSPEYSWRPWGVPHRIVASAAHACRPCRIAGCGNGKISDCLETMDAATVLDAFHSLARETHGA